MKFWIYGHFGYVVNFTRTKPWTIYPELSVHWKAILPFCTIKAGIPHKNGADPVRSPHPLTAMLSDRPSDGGGEDGQGVEGRAATAAVVAGKGGGRGGREPARHGHWDPGHGRRWPGGQWGPWCRISYRWDSHSFFKYRILRQMNKFYVRNGFF